MAHSAPGHYGDAGGRCALYTAEMGNRVEAVPPQTLTFPIGVILAL